MQGKKSNKMMLIIIIIVVVLGAAVAVYFFTQKEETTNTAATTNTTAATNATPAANTNTEADPYDGLMQYDDNIIGIASIDGKVTGLAAISIDTAQTMPIAVVYFLKVDDALPKSVAANVGAGESYYYIANHTTADAIKVGDGTGVLSEAFCNPDEMPEILVLAQERSIDLELYRGCDAQYDVYHTTETFYHLYIDYYNNYTFDYDEIIGNDTLAIFDEAPYYEADEELGGWGADDALVISQAEPAATYELVYSD
ncbi:hypothetical protein KKF61_02880 [Patescibacteria group bacterium]|nr:hypothetical protein [Patescibacteria group bacterium]